MGLQCAANISGSEDTYGCRVPCTGLYADVRLGWESPCRGMALCYMEWCADIVSHLPGESREAEGLEVQVREYWDYRSRSVRNLQYDPTIDNLSIHCIMESPVVSQLPPARVLRAAPLQIVQIYFDTATFDLIESDVRMTLEAQLGLIGGTLGLFTGFSVLSGVEIVYFAARIFLGLGRKKRL